MNQKELQLINTYNTSDCVVMIATYPEGKNGSIQHLNAVAAHSGHMAKYLPVSLAKYGKKLIILCQTDGEPFVSEENGVLIYRCWKKDSSIAYIHMLKVLRSFNHVSQVFTHFEFHEFGGNLSTLVFPLFLGLAKLMGKNITVLMHQVVTDITTLSKHVNILPGTFKATIFNCAIKMFYFISGNISDKVIVHDDIFATRLKSMTGRRDIVTIPLGLGVRASKQIISRQFARKKLGIDTDEFVVIAFGFLAWYKGTDWLISHWKTIAKGKRMKLILAGGESPNVKDKPHYQAFIQQIKQTLKANPAIMVTGFIEDKDVPLYFAAADVSVLPYRALMSSSGPLAMSIAFKKPFLMSKALLPYTEDADFQEVLSTQSMSAKEISFALTPKSLTQALENVKVHGDRYQQLSASLYQLRNWEAVSDMFAQTIGRSLGYPRAIHSVIIRAKQLYAYAPRFGQTS